MNPEDEGGSGGAVPGKDTDEKSEKNKKEAKAFFTQALESLKKVENKDIREKSKEWTGKETTNTNEMKFAKRLLGILYFQFTKKNAWNYFEESFGLLLADRLLCGMKNVLLSIDKKKMPEIHQLLSLELSKYMHNVIIARALSFEDKDMYIPVREQPFSGISTTGNTGYDDAFWYSEWAHDMRIQYANFFIDIAKKGFDGIFVDAGYLSTLSLLLIHIHVIEVERMKLLLMTKTEDLTKDIHAEKTDIQKIDELVRLTMKTNTFL
jgi:hypothetical protein